MDQRPHGLQGKDEEERGRGRGETEAAEGKQAHKGRKHRTRTMEVQTRRKENHHKGARTQQAGGPRRRRKQPIVQQKRVPKKATKTEAKSGAKFGHIKTDTDDNGDTVVHITIKSTGKDKKKRSEQ